MIAQISPLAGKTIAPSMLVNVPRLVTVYFTGKPDPTVPSQRVAFGTVSCDRLLVKTSSRLDNWHSYVARLFMDAAFVLP